MYTLIIIIISIYKSTHGSAINPYKIARTRAYCYKLIVCLNVERTFLTNERAITLFVPMSAEKSNSSLSSPIT